MVRHKGKVELRVSQLREFAEQLRAVADNCDANCDLASARDIQTLAVTHFPTAQDGIESISKFAGAIYTAASEAILKNTLNTAETGASPKKSGRKRSEPD